MEVCKEELCESNEIHEDLLKIVDETLPEETELYDLAELFKVFGGLYQNSFFVCFV